MSTTSTRPASQASPVISETKTVEEIVQDETSPDFIYGGPFITTQTKSPFLNIATPFNTQLQGTFKK